MQAGGSFEPEDVSGLGDIRRTFLHVVLEGRVGHVIEGFAAAVNLLPDQFRPLQRSGSRRGGEIKVIVGRGRGFDAQADTLGQVSPVRIVPDLVAATENM